MSGVINAERLAIPKQHIFASHALGEISLYHDDNGFEVVRDGEVISIERCNIDSSLRDLSSEQLEFRLGMKKRLWINNQECVFIHVPEEEHDKVMDESVSIVCDDESTTDLQRHLSGSAYIFIKRLNNGEYALHLCDRLPGGGLWGATLGCWIGKFVASAICHTGILLVTAAVSVVATPAVGAVVGMSLESTLGSAIETVTTAGAIAGGITLAVATGPV